MADSIVDEFTRRLARVDHETVGEFHGLCTSSTEFSRHDNFATLRTRLHDETGDTIACTTDGKTTKELVEQALALSNGGKTTVLDLIRVELKRVVGELEALLDERGELTDSASLLAEYLLGVCCADDDVGNGGRDADLDARVSLLSQLALEELVQLGVEDTVSDELSALRTVEVDTLVCLAFS